MGIQETKRKIGGDGLNPDGNKLGDLGAGIKQPEGIAGQDPVPLVWFDDGTGGIANPWNDGDIWVDSGNVTPPPSPSFPYTLPITFTA
jgi:hypothetical protein